MSNDKLLKVEVIDGQIYVDGAVLERMPMPDRTPEEEEALRLRILEDEPLPEAKLRADRKINEAFEIYKDIRFIKNQLKGYSPEQAKELTEIQNVRPRIVRRKMDAAVKECTARDYEKLVEWLCDRSRKNDQILYPRLSRLKEQLEQKRERHGRPKGPQPS